MKSPVPPPAVPASLWSLALQQAPTGFALLDSDGCVLQANAALGRMLGLPAGQLAGQELAGFLEENPEYDQTPAPDLLQAARQSAIDLELRLRADGQPSRWVLLSLASLQAVAPAAFLAQVQDIEARKQAEVLQIEHVATLHAASGELQRELHRVWTHDALTGLPNRTSFEAELASISGGAQGGESGRALIFLGLDRFKVINDTAGHDVGDALLRYVAQWLRRRLPAGDVLARLGGDEFALLMHRGLESAECWVEQLLHELAARPFVWQGRRYDVGASAGIAAVGVGTEPVPVLMGQADVACYAAKAAGRNRVCVYRADAIDTLERHRELQVVSGLRQTLESDRGVLYAQRIVASDQRDEQRFEVLVRMLDDHGVLQPPTSFIPAAEHYDRMTLIDRWVFETVLLRHSEDLVQLPGLVLHLNISANSLNDHNFLTWMQQLLRETQVPAGRLVFEVTETALIGNLAHAAQTIHRLRELGCGVALDDFGIGLSSFNYMRTFPVNFVKIDGSFIQRMPHSVVDLRIVRAIHDIAQVLGARTIAEAVENTEVFDLVAATGIHYAQGFGLHHPEPFSDVLDGLRGKRTPSV
ncbi:MAG: EAL domain-containing protein [Pigmentiphaga sp.]